MRQETINIYTIETHPEPSLCFEWIRDNWHDLSEHVMTDIIASLKELAHRIDGVLDYSISCVPCRGEYITIKDFDKDALKALHETRETQPLTGYYHDQTVIEALYDDELSYKVLKELHDETAYMYKDESLRELCLANGYEFYANGKIY